MAGRLTSVSAFVFALILIAGCSGGGRDRDSGRADGGQGNRVFSGEKSGPGKNGNASSAAGAEDEGTDAGEGDGPDGDAQGPKPATQASAGGGRPARCQVDDGPVGSCTFTPVMGDGSFEIETASEHLRVVVDGEEAVAFAVVGDRRVPLAGTLVRDSDDRACWVAAEEGVGPSRICAW